MLLPVLLVAGMAYGHTGIRQNAGADTSDIQPAIPGKTLRKLERSYHRLGSSITRSSEKALNRMQRLERSLLACTGNTDTASMEAAYRKMFSSLQQAGTGSAGLAAYLPVADSLQTTLRFLGQGGSLSSELSALQNQFSGATGVMQFIRQREQELESRLSASGMMKELTAIRKQAYYCRQQWLEYKQALSDPDKAAEKILMLARSSSQFNEFFSRNSLLSRLFPMPAGYGAAQALQGLQTRNNVQQLIGSQLAAAPGGAAGAQGYVQQQLSQAQAQLNTLKDKLNRIGGSSDDLQMPGFKPNHQRTKSFWKRIEYGLNIQSQRPNGLLPVTSDLALTMGYKLNDKSVLGIGGSYKIGWGKDISHIQISGQGISLRSYLDMKIKGSIWVSGGYEYNYQHAFRGIEALQHLDAWQKSGLIGITKKYHIGKRNGNLQLLWDFLSYGQVPKTQPLKFRIGYMF